MSKREAIARYNLIISKLRRKASSFKEIAAFLERESELQAYNFNVSVRTFQRDLEDIRSLYNIDIQYDFSHRVYFIDDAGQPDVNNRLLEAFDTFNVLNISDNLAEYLHFEKRKPQGTENLYGLLHAIKNNFLIKFSYQKFWEDIITHRKVAPVALKEFKNRWYVLGREEDGDAVKSFALDRLTNLEITNIKFNGHAPYSIEESYHHCFGIISPTDEAPEDILLCFKPIQGKYIKTLPLHHTQEIVSDTESELQVKLKLFITHDFVMELLSYGNDMKVLKPVSLAERIRKALQAAYSQY